jgi:hypothetical protein
MVTESLPETPATPTTGWRQYIRVHPACDVLPLLPPDQLRELADDIEQNGLRERIRVAGVGFGGLSGAPTKGVLIDGRNRLDAWALLGRPIIDPATGDWHRDFRSHVDPSTMLALDGSRPSLDHADIVREVVSRNIRRRHLSEKDRVELALKVVEAATVAATNGTPVPASVTSPAKTGKPAPVSDKGGCGRTGVVSTVAKLAGVSKPTARKHLAAKGVVAKPVPAAKPLPSPVAALGKMRVAISPTTATTGSAYLRAKSTVKERPVFGPLWAVTLRIAKGKPDLLPVLAGFYRALADAIADGSLARVAKTKGGAR